MNLRHAIKIGLMVLLSAAVPIALISVWGHEDQQIWPSGQLTPQEETLARTLAERELAKPEHNIGSSEKIYFTRIQLLPDSQAETSQREAIVTHYRYQGNQAILSYVDLNTETVYKVEKVTNLPTPLAKEELQLAMELAKADARLQPLFQEYGNTLHVEGKPGGAERSTDPSRPQRQVHLLFRVGRNYLSGPRVIVDLATETVQVEEVR